jgi:hypothetical protein
MDEAEEKLFVEFILGPEITENPAFAPAGSTTGKGTLYGWCTNELSEEDVNPNCTVEIVNPEGEVMSADVIIPTYGKTAEINISALPYNVNYRFYLKVNSADPKGSAISPTQQFVKNIPIAPHQVGPLAITSVSRYTCMISPNIELSTGELIMQEFYRLFFYYSSSEYPLPVSPDLPTVICHDKPANLVEYPREDEATYPRIENQPNEFALWHPKVDSRFFDYDENGIVDMNDILANRLRARNIDPANLEFFRPFEWLTSPTSDDSGNSETGGVNLGFILMPFKSPGSFGAPPAIFCPSVENNLLYSHPILDELASFIQDTEPLYMGKEQDNNGAVDQDHYVFFPESKLKEIWWYQDGNGGPLVQFEDPALLRQKQVGFYFPPYPDEPTVKQSFQTTFYLKEPSGENNGDFAVGCIPKVVN